MRGNADRSLRIAGALHHVSFVAAIVRGHRVRSVQVLACALGTMLFNLNSKRMFTGIYTAYKITDLTPNIYLALYSCYLYFTVRAKLRLFFPSTNFP